MGNTIELQKGDLIVSLSLMNASITSSSVLVLKLEDYDGLENPWLTKHGVVVEERDIVAVFR